MEITREAKSKEDKDFAPYAPEEELGTYKIKRWTWREKQEAMMRSSTILDETKGLLQMDLIDFQVEQILVCVTPPESLIDSLPVEEGEDEKPMWDKERVNIIDADIGDILLAACRKVNGTTLSERSSFLEPSASTENTPG